jgi:WD40 repeat protein
MNLKCTRIIQTNHKKTIYKLLFLENETKFATASEDSTICIWFTQTGELFKTLTGHTDRIWNLIELTDNRYNIKKIDWRQEAVIIKSESGI